MSRLRTVAVTGTTGYVGRFVVAELQHQGVSVRGLARPGSDRRGFPAPVDWVVGDMRAIEAFPALVNGVDAVIHLAYEHVPGRYRGGEGDDLDGWLESNLNGTLRLLQAAQEANVPQFIFLSSRAVFSRTDPGRVLDETHSISPNTHYGAYKAAVEAFLQSYSGLYNMATTSVRATGVYGLTYPVQRTKWWDLVTGVLNGEDNFTNGGGTEVHGRDVARVIWALLARPDLDIPVIHLSDRYVTHRQVVELARHFSGHPGPLPQAPSASPANPLACHRIAELGLAFGGLPLLESTVAEMVEIAKFEESP
jgi:nucleoside-diphosphate-sugar epimerase